MLTSARAEKGLGLAKAYAGSRGFRIGMLEKRKKGATNLQDSQYRSFEDGLFNGWSGHGFVLVSHGDTF
jgi:hypothetical protein